MAQPKGQTSGPGPPAALFKLEKSLKKRYEKGIIQLPGTRPELQKALPDSKKYNAKESPLDDVYVKLHILEKSELKEKVGHAAVQGTATEMERMAHVFSCGAKATRCLEMSEVLTLASRPQCRLPQKDGVRVLALAGAGMGKTTAFLKKGPMEWMKGDIWQDVELLFAFPLRQPEVHLAKDLKQLLGLSRHDIHRRNDREDILEYVSENLHRVCIIFDGLDEVDISNCSAFIQDVIKGDDLDGVRLIVTSRPSIPVIELAKEHPFNMRIEALGFSEDDVARYVNKVLRQDDAANVLAQTAASPALAGYMQIPVNAAHICMLYRSGVTTIPTTMSAITSAIIRQIIQQNEKKKALSERVDVAESLEDVNPILLDPVKELQAFAFKMLVDKVMVFEKRHFDQCQLSKEARSLGILVACDYDSQDATPQFVFTHLSIHESLSARHVASSITQADDAGWMVQRLGSLTGHLNTFWRFLAAELDAEAVNSLIVALLHKPKENADSPNSRVSVIQNSSSVVVPSESADDVAAQAAMRTEDPHGDMCVERLLQHLSSCFHIINLDSLGGPVSPEFMERYVKPRRPLLQQPLAVSGQQEPVAQVYSLSSVTAEADVTNLKHFFSASHSELCQVADNLSEHLDIANAERLADRLLEGVVHGSATLAVKADIPLASEPRGRDFLRALLQFWKQRVPRASIQMLYRAIADFDMSIATKCFPSLDHVISRSSLVAPVPDTPLEIVDLVSEEGNQLILLCFHCYHDYCSSHDSTPMLLGLSDVLGQIGSLDFSDSRLTAADCRAIGLVLQIYHSVLKGVQLSSCHIHDAGYGQLAAGLGTCRKLDSLNLCDNNLTDAHVSHLGTVIRNNKDTLHTVWTCGNSFSSAGFADVHRYTHLCHSLRILAIGSPECVDPRTNISIIVRILTNCPRVLNLVLTGSLDLCSLDQLNSVLVSHRLAGLSLCEIGLTPKSSPVISRILHRHQTKLTLLDLSKNSLSTDFLVENFKALAGCVHLENIFLFGTQLSSVSLLVIVDLFGSWPLLQWLNLANNDFREDEGNFLEFAQAVEDHSNLRKIQMPDRAWVNSVLWSVLSGLNAGYDGLTVEFENIGEQQEAIEGAREVQARVETEYDNPPDGDRRVRHTSSYVTVYDNPPDDDQASET